MAEYIDRNELKKMVHFSGHGMDYDAYEVQEMPNADVVERKRGEWVEVEFWWDDVYYYCSICGESFCLIDGTPTYNLYNFCPNCGADMREET